MEAREAIDVLAKIGALAHDKQGLLLDGRHVSLWLSFWAREEIQEGIALRDEWGVDVDLVPFWGDWHDLICLSLATGRVVFLNDDRAVVGEWVDTDQFINSLTSAAPPETGPSPRLLSATFSPELDELAANLRNQTTAKSKHDP